MPYKTATLDGKKIIYSETTRFEVQVGRYHSSYQIKHVFTGNLAQAVLYFNALNIGYGYKKRLLMPGARKPVLARQFS